MVDTVCLSTLTPATPLALVAAQAGHGRVIRAMARSPLRT